jgi:hypothetical protein
MPDIDIDLPASFKPESFFEAVRGSQILNEELKPHPCGFYFQPIPKEAIT